MKMFLEIVLVLGKPAFRNQKYRTLEALEVEEGKKKRETESNMQLSKGTKWNYRDVAVTYSCSQYWKNNTVRGTLQGTERNGFI